LTSRHTIRNLTSSMRIRKRTHEVVAVGLLIIAIIAVLGHVCVLPLHAHMVPAADHGSHDETPGDSVHTASCDALKSTSATPSIIPIAAWTPILVVEPGARRLVGSARETAGAESPPLFLLHAALLI
jgi:hypothetical protein